MRKISVLLPVVFLLAGCGEQKTREERMADVKNLKKRYELCIKQKKAKEGDIFCEYTLQEPDFMQKIILLGTENQQQLGQEVLHIQQEIDRLSSIGDTADQELLEKNRMRLKKSYLILKMLSSIK